MARQALGQIGSADRHRFVGEFVRYGKKRGWEGVEEETVLLRNIRLADSNRQVADHLWLNRTLGWEDVGMDDDGKEALRGGESIAFTARVAEYTKGYQGYRDDMYAPIVADWKLERPTKFSIVRGENP